MRLIRTATELEEERVSLFLLKKYPAGIAVGTYSDVIESTVTVIDESAEGWARYPGVSPGRAHPYKRRGHTTAQASLSKMLGGRQIPHQVSRIRPPWADEVSPRLGEIPRCLRLSTQTASKIDATTTNTKGPFRGLFLCNKKENEKEE